MTYLHSYHVCDGPLHWYRLRRLRELEVLSRQPTHLQPVLFNDTMVTDCITKSARNMKGKVQDSFEIISWKWR